MQYLLFTGPNGYTSFYGPLTVAQTNDLIAQFNLSAGTYAIVTDITVLPAGWENYPKGVTFTAPSTIGFDFTLAQLESKEKVAASFQDQANNALSLVPQLVLSTQAALPEVDRIPAANTMINTMNAIATDMQSVFDMVDAATTLAELNAINNPPAISGTILLDRDALTLDDSVFASLLGAAQADMYLYIPATATTLNFDPIINGFSSSGSDVFIIGDYRVQLRYAGNVIANFNLSTEVPTNYDFAFVPPTPDL